MNTGEAQVKFVTHPEVIVYPRAASLLRNLIPVVPITFNKFYAEARYNYDFENTAGAYVGKSFSGQGRVNQKLIPQAGALIGDFSGSSIQFYYRLETKRFELNFQNQYAVSIRNANDRFYYNWSSLELKLTRHFSAGGSTQLYFNSYNQKGNYNDNGLFVVVKKSRLYFFLFDFNAYDPPTHYLLTGFVYSIISPGKGKI
ncbi:hypothetical protein WSM22_40830 [Cytophagales bacterium WSM2-2]|nr:hypothetical protein WSM22_40830 [Cytophagales bacterium WSM2-2]